MVNLRNELTVIVSRTRYSHTPVRMMKAKKGKSKRAREKLCLIHSNSLHRRIDYVLKRNASNKVQNFINQFFLSIFLPYEAIWYVYSVDLLNNLHFIAAIDYTIGSLYHAECAGAIMTTDLCASVSIYLFIYLFEHREKFIVSAFLFALTSQRRAHTFFQPNKRTFLCISDMSHLLLVLMYEQYKYKESTINMRRKKKETESKRFQVFI